MAEWPKRYYRARYEADTYVIDTGDPADGYQLRPDTWHELADWCGGNRALVDGDQAIMVNNQTAVLGDFVMLHNGVFHVEPADGHYQRWAPA